MGPTAAIMPDGKRLHLQHGPIDLVIGADGAADDVRTAYGAARDRFQTVLSGLVEELPALRRPLSASSGLNGPVARRMADAVRPHDTVFVTPMAAVAGSVADEVLGVMRAAAPGLAKIWVNNGGDIALHLAGDARFDAVMVAHPQTGVEAGRITISAADNIGGIATSGRHGRSLSLGIADAVTVLADSAARADVAATLAANAVDLPGHPGIARAAACEIDPDSDLGSRPVVVDVGRLRDAEVQQALARGRVAAEEMITAGWVHAVMLCLQDHSVTLPQSPVFGQDPRITNHLHQSGTSHVSRSPEQVREQKTLSQMELAP